MNRSTTRPIVCPTIRAVALFVASLSALTFAASALAQIDVSVSPPRLELAALPGEPVSASVILLSGGPEEAMSVTLEDFLLTPAGEAVFMPAESLETSLCPYLSVLPSTLTLAAGGRAEVTVQVSLPPDAEGLYSCVAFFRTAPKPRAQGGVQVLFSGQVGLTVYASVPGGAQPDGVISELEITPEAVRFVFENRGNTLLRPEGRVQLLSEAGAEVARVPVDEFPVLPGGYREVQLELPELPPGRYAVFVLLEAGALPFAAEGVVTLP